jgi:LysR family glycine cleavage system transcriptional activator
MAQRLPPLNALRAFEVASRVGSFTLAARELSVSQGAVSRHVARLEDFLGVQLFERGHREVKLTALGQAYAEDIRQVFVRIQQTTGRIQAHGGVRKAMRQLRVALFPSIASRWLMPRLARFRAAHPDVELVLTTTSAPPDLEEGAVDIINIRGDPGRATVEYRPLFDITIQPVCIRALMEAPPGLTKPSDLSRYVLLQSMNRLSDWAIWLAEAGAPAVQPEHSVKFEHSALAYEAAIDGLGVAIAQTAFVQDELADGRLVAPFPLAVRTGENYGLAWLHAKAADPAVRAFSDWMCAEAACPGRAAAAS